MKLLGYLILGLLFLFWTYFLRTLSGWKWVEIIIYFISIVLLTGIIVFAAWLIV